MLAYAAGRELWLEQLSAGADPAFRIGGRRRHRDRLARAVHPQPAAPRPATTRRCDATILHLPGFTADPARHGTRTGTVIALDMTPEHRSHRRHRLCRRDQEIGVLAAQFPRPAARHLPDALLGQYRRGRRHGAVLRPQRHRQDHAQLRSGAAADRRRRAFVERRRRRQYRGRLLRQDRASSAPRPSPRSSPRRRASARCSRTSCSMRRRARFRRSVAAPRTPAPPIRSTTLSVGRARAASARSRQDRGVPHRRCLRRAAADRPADAGAGGRAVPLGLHRQGRRHRARRHRADRHLLGLLRRAVHVAPSARSMATCSPTGSPRAAPASG